MMLDLFLNPLSANRQITDRQQLNLAVSGLLDCVSLIRPGLQAGTMSLTYDSSIERRALTNGSPVLASCLAMLDRDLRTRWYSITRSARKIGAAFCTIEMRGNGEAIIGDASPELLGAEILASFGGSKACDAEDVELIDAQSGTTALCKSVSRSDKLARLLPLYEPNPKHRATGYMRDGGNYVAPMSIDTVEAQKGLYAAVPDGNGALYGLISGKFVKYVLTGGTTYHAYEVPLEEIPGAVQEVLKLR